MASATTELCPACASPRDPGQAVCAVCGWVYAPAALRPALAVGEGEHFAPGQAISGGRYRVLRPLSRGGMGALYLASDQEAFGRTVVVKTLLASLDALPPAEAQAALSRFVQEARTLAGLRYPSIPQIYSYFHDGPLACIVMEYIEGDDLSHGLSRPGAPGQGRPYPLPEVLRWAVELCKTLEYLASARPPVVHQDIKPANLIRDAHSGQLYLVDFGAARERPAAAPRSGTAIFGTPGYAAPEQYRGASSPASDVYALAATLYHLVSDDDPGEHPFDFPKLARLGYFGRLLQGALADDPGRRPTAAELRQGVEALLAPDAARTLVAPDGEELQGEQELARWCEGHWAQARDWLYADLPQAVERELVQLDLARKLRACVDRHPSNRNAGLDAALARLDPQGFGAARPTVRLWPDKVEIRAIRPNVPVSGLVKIQNTSRRYARASLSTPPWLAASPSPATALQAAQSISGPPPLAVELEPGQELELSLAPVRASLATAGYQQGSLLLRIGSQAVAKTLVGGSFAGYAQTDARISEQVPKILLAVLILIVVVRLLILLSTGS